MTAQHPAPWSMGDSGIIYDNDAVEVPEQADFTAYRAYCFARDDMGEYPMTYQDWQISGRPTGAA